MFDHRRPSRISSCFLALEGAIEELLSRSGRINPKVKIVKANGVMRNLSIRSYELDMFFLGQVESDSHGIETLDGLWRSTYGGNDRIVLGSPVFDTLNLEEEWKDARTCLHKFFSKETGGIILREIISYLEGVVESESQELIKEIQFVYENGVTTANLVFTPEVERKLRETLESWEIEELKTFTFR